MSSWSCPHLDEKRDWCRRLNTDCVPGRKGCVLPRNMTFAVPPEQRVEAKKAERLRREGPGHAASPDVTA